MKVLFLHKYSQKAASFRYRFSQYYSHLEKLGIECDTLSLLEDSYLEKKYSKEPISKMELLGCYFKRVRNVLKAKRYDATVIYFELLPYIPFFIEKWFLKKLHPFVIDMDDALFLQYDKNSNRALRWGLKNKIGKVLQEASHVFAGNPNLAAYAHNWNENVSVVPTVVDLNTYSSRKSNFPMSGALTVGWMGSPSTSQSLNLIKDPLERLVNKKNWKLNLVGASREAIGDWHPTRPWSEETFLKDLLHMDIGIMPLEDTEWSRGKCGFKLIQYMACGLPVVASPVGVNSEIIEHGKSGFLATTESEWNQAFDAFDSNRELLSQFGTRGYERVTTQYNVQSQALVVSKILHDLRGY